VNVIVEDDKSVKDTIVIPGHKEKHNTVINIPTPEKVSSRITACEIFNQYDQGRVGLRKKCRDAD